MLIDSGASFHLTGHLCDPTQQRKLPSPVSVTVADGRSITICIVGQLALPVVNQDGQPHPAELVFRNVYHVPTFSVTLVSVSQLVQAGYNARFADNEWGVLTGRTRTKLLVAQEVAGVYEVVTSETPTRPHEQGSAYLAALSLKSSLST